MVYEKRNFRKLNQFLSYECSKWTMQSLFRHLCFVVGVILGLTINAIFIHIDSGILNNSPSVVFNLTTPSDSSYTVHRVLVHQYELDLIQRYMPDTFDRTVPYSDPSEIDSLEWDTLLIIKRREFGCLKRLKKHLEWTAIGNFENECFALVSRGFSSGLMVPLDFTGARKSHSGFKDLIELEKDFIEYEKQMRTYDNRFVYWQYFNKTHHHCRETLSEEPIPTRPWIINSAYSLLSRNKVPHSEFLHGWLQTSIDSGYSIMVATKNTLFQGKWNLNLSKESSEIKIKDPRTVIIHWISELKDNEQTLQTIKNSEFKVLRYIITDKLESPESLKIPNALVFNRKDPVADEATPSIKTIENIVQTIIPAYEEEAIFLYTSCSQLILDPKFLRRVYEVTTLNSMVYAPIPKTKPTYRGSGILKLTENWNIIAFNKNQFSQVKHFWKNGNVIPKDIIRTTDSDLLITKGCFNQSDSRSLGKRNALNSLFLKRSKDPYGSL